MHENGQEDDANLDAGLKATVRHAMPVTEHSQLRRRGQTRATRLDIGALSIDTTTSRSHLNQSEQIALCSELQGHKSTAVLKDDNECLNRELYFVLAKHMKFINRS